MLRQYAHLNVLGLRGCARKEVTSSCGVVRKGALCRFIRSSKLERSLVFCAKPTFLPKISPRFCKALPNHAFERTRRSVRGSALIFGARAAQRER